MSNVLINGKPLDDRQLYSLAGTNYVVRDGGDGYDMFRNAKVLIGPEQAPSEADILQKKIAGVASIAPMTDGRITRLDAPKDQKRCD